MSKVHTLNVRVRDVKEAQALCHIVSQFNYDIDLRQARYVVDAKSILGILSLDLSQPLLLDAYTGDVSELLAALTHFLI